MKIMTIRRAFASDYEAVKQLLVSEEMTEASFFSIERFSRYLIDNWRYCFVEERDNKVVGFIGGFDDGGSFHGFLEKLVVDPAYRRQDIGTSLLTKSLEEFKKSGTPIVYLGVNQKNLIARGLFKKFGFKEQGYDLLYLERE